MKQLKKWTKFNSDPMLVQLSTTSGLFVCRSEDTNAPADSFFLVDQENRTFRIAWDYSDVEFKFEVFHLSIAKADMPPPLKRVAEVERDWRLTVLSRCEWVRPAAHDEVPANFEQVIEEGGAEAAVPDNATVGAVSLFGLLFRGRDQRARLCITIDLDSMYTLKLLREEEIQEILGVCDESAVEDWLRRNVV